jgi:23S rRNA (uracil1939-C5)-methyltransferase
MGRYKQRRVKGNAQQREKFLQIFSGLRKEFTQRVEVPCEHFEDCGGCKLQAHNYSDQVEIKRRSLEKLIEVTPGVSALKKLRVGAVASPRDYHYRQRMDFIVTPRGVGLRSSDGKQLTVDINNCHLIEDESLKYFMAAKSLVSELGVVPYNPTTHEGEMRYITIRRTRHNQQMVAFLTTSAMTEEKMSPLVERMRELGACSVYWSIDDGLGDDVSGEVRQFWGQEFIEEELLGKKFILGPLTFFQSNHDVAGFAYSEIREFIQKCGAKKILDLYSGTCTMPILFADLVDEVTAVENYSDNVAMARKNFEANEVSNVSLLEADVAEYLQAEGLNFEFSVLNPPRKGMNEAAVRRILEFKPKNLAYLSCHPRTLLEDLGILFREYTPIEIKIFDMFPQTEHFETLVLLELKK